MLGVQKERVERSSHLAAIYYPTNQAFSLRMWARRNHKLLQRLRLSLAKLLSGDCWVAFWRVCFVKIVIHPGTPKQPTSVCQCEDFQTERPWISYFNSSIKPWPQASRRVAVSIEHVSTGNAGPLPRQCFNAETMLRQHQDNIGFVPFKKQAVGAKE